MNVKLKDVYMEELEDYSNMAGGIFMEKNRMKLYFEWRTAVEMAVVLYGILIVIITWLKVFEENGTQAGT